MSLCFLAGPKEGKNSLNMCFNSSGFARSRSSSLRLKGRVKPPGHSSPPVVSELLGGFEDYNDCSSCSLSFSLSTRLGVGGRSSSSPRTRTPTCMSWQALRDLAGGFSPTSLAVQPLSRLCRHPVMQTQQIGKELTTKHDPCCSLSLSLSLSLFLSLWCL